MTDAAVLGCGNMGSAVARCLAHNRISVSVWNRTSDKAKALESEQIRPMPAVSDALSSSDLILISLTDYAAFYECVQSSGNQLKGSTVVQLTTGKPEEARDLSKCNKQRRVLSCWRCNGVPTRRWHQCSSNLLQRRREYFQLTATNTRLSRWCSICG